MEVFWDYSRSHGADMAMIGEWRIWVYEDHDHRWNVTSDWGDTYRGAPTRTDAIDIAERFIRQRYG